MTPRKTGTASQSHSTGFEKSQSASSELTTSFSGFIDEILQLFKSRWLKLETELQLGVARDLSMKFSLSISTLSERSPENIQWESDVKRFRDRSRYSKCCKSRAQPFSSEYKLQLRRMMIKLFLCSLKTSFDIVSSGLKEPLIASADDGNSGSSFKFELVTAILCRFRNPLKSNFRLFSAESATFTFDKSSTFSFGRSSFISKIEVGIIIFSRASRLSLFGKWEKRRGLSRAQTVNCRIFDRFGDK